MIANRQHAVVGSGLRLKLTYRAVEPNVGLPGNLCPMAPSAVLVLCGGRAPNAQKMGEAFGSISTSIKGEIHVDEFTAQACSTSFGFEGRENTHSDVRERGIFLFQLG